MNLQATIKIYGYGTSEGVRKEWDTRGRGRHPAPTGEDWDVKTPTNEFYQDGKGHYLPDRAAKVHDPLIAKYQHKPTQINPAMTVILGGAVSGKSTYMDQHAAKLRSPAMIDVDKFRAELPEFQKIAGTKNTILTRTEGGQVRDAALLSAVGHNNDIALEAVGHPDTPDKIDGIEKSGYKVGVVYIHRPVADSVDMAVKRAATAKEASRRVVLDPAIVYESHADSRNALARMVKPGREVTIYDGTGHFDPTKQYDVIYHRGADGKVDVKNEKAMERMRNAEEPKIPDVF